MSSSGSDKRRLVGAIDQGTSSSRFLVFDAADESVVAMHQIEIESKFPHEGWVEQDPEEYVSTTKECIRRVCADLSKRGLLSSLCAVGITNQRETTVVWDKTTGKPLHNAIVWLDTRTRDTVQNLIKNKAGAKGMDVLRDKCGLPISTYFSALKLRWLLDNVSAVSSAAKSGNLLFGTVDSWLIWKLTTESRHVTDVTNASRTMLMSLQSLQWDDELLRFFDVPKAVLPEIRSSAEVYGHLGYADSPIPEVPLSGCLGDQQAALVGQYCLKPGMAKNTYGTGCFMLYNVGKSVVRSDHGLLSTVAYKLGPDAEAHFALEGSIAVAGAAVTWLKNNLGLFEKASDIERLAASVEDTAGVYFVPAFSGLFAPHWRSDARGVICGLTQFARREHICRAALEATCLFTRDIVDAMQKDSGLGITHLLVDGAMTGNELMMQMQADFLGISVIRPEMSELTALGAAMAAGMAVGAWSTDVAGSARKEKTFEAQMSAAAWTAKYKDWRRALTKSFDWVDDHHE